MTENVRVRFAPSPTGHLHIGGARTAIYNWAFARRFGGTFVLRIDDTDPERSKDEYTQGILNSMKWLGLDWDEGPEKGGDYGPYFQMQRMDIYKAAFEKLKEKGAVYPCFCKAEDIAAKREAAQKAGGYAGYDRSCRDIPYEEARARIDAGEECCWRLKVPLDRGDIVMHDAIRGDVVFDAALQDDFVVMRSDGSPTYNFASVVDDAEMGITHIIRGDDHISNTPRQILVFEALGAPVPMFAHLAMIWGPDKHKLSKRHGATSVESYREEGYLPEAIDNYLALLGWALDGETTIFSTQTLCENFSLDHISKNPAIFDFDKLAWMNAEYIKALPEEDFLAAILPYLVDAGLCTEEDAASNHEWFLKLRPLVFERMKLLPDCVEKLRFLFQDESNFEMIEADRNKALAKEGTAPILEMFISEVEKLKDNWNLDAINETLHEIPAKMELKPRVVFQVARIAITGALVSPPLFESMELLGYEECLRRLVAARQYVQE